MPRDRVFDKPSPPVEPEMPQFYFGVNVKLKLVKLIITMDDLGLHCSVNTDHFPLIKQIEGQPFQLDTVKLEI